MAELSDRILYWPYVTAEEPYFGFISRVLGDDSVNIAYFDHAGIARNATNVRFGTSEKGPYCINPQDVKKKRGRPKTVK